MTHVDEGNRVDEDKVAALGLPELTGFCSNTTGE